MSDTFTAVPGFDRYFATRDGHVYKYNKEFDEYNIVGTYPRNGDSPVVYINGKHLTVARLVALAYITNDIGKNAIVFHYDTNPSNNRVENLVWVTYGELRRLTSRKNISELYKSYLEKMRENNE